MSKQINNRKTSAEVVASAAETHTQRISEQFKALVASQARPEDGAAIPDLGYAMVLVARALRATNQTLVEADAAHQRELSDDKGPRDTRDASLQELSGELISLREALKTTYGPEGPRQCGFRGPTPEDPRALETLAEKVLERLKNAGEPWPAPSSKGLMLDTSAWIADIEGALERLKRSLQDVQREVREAQATGATRAKAMAAYDTTFSRSATLISAVLRFVGEDALASRVRPSGRRPGTLATDDEPDPTPSSS